LLRIEIVEGYKQPTETVYLILFRHFVDTGIVNGEFLSADADCQKR